jgi:phytanoyl-CoA hydroxylase
MLDSLSGLSYAVNVAVPKTEGIGVMGNSCGAQIDRLRLDGYVVVPDFVPPGKLGKLNEVARIQLAARSPPLEFEADLKYPGAPSSHAAPGGETVRRLLDAYSRSPVLARSAVTPRLRDWMEAYFGEDVLLSRAHHNCLMTKHPLYGSMTGWHRDIRFWSFGREDLVSVWLALGEETDRNGALWFVPGSHRMEFAAERFDGTMFFRADRADNSTLILTAQSPHLRPGDAVFFHCNTLHSAGKNHGDTVKFSLVYSYHGRSNPPQPGTRSASQPEVELRAIVQP